MPLPRRKNSLLCYALKPGLAVVSLAISLAVAEGGLRLLDYQPHFGRRSRLGRQMIRHPAPNIPYLYKPGASFSEHWPSDPRDYFRAPNHGVRYRVNRAGFRGPDFSLMRTQNVRIAFLGNSFCWGNGVRQEDHFTTILQQELP